MSADGQVLIVGAPNWDSGKGRVVVYKKDENGHFQQIGFTFTDNNKNDLETRLGEHVQVSDDGTVIAFSKNCKLTNKIRSVETWKWDGGMWNKISTLSDIQKDDDSQKHDFGFGPVQVGEVGRHSYILDLKLGGDGNCLAVIFGPAMRNRSDDRYDTVPEVVD